MGASAAGEDALSANPQQSEGAVPARSILPPFVVLRDFLTAETVRELFEFALARERAFAPTRTGRNESRNVRPEVRVSLGLRDLGAFRPMLKDKMQAIAPGLVAKLGMTPVDSPRFETELVAHNDGAFYKRHIDTHTASDRDIRILSAVYYFHAEPKAFTGGALRLYAIGDPAGARFVDIEPEHNTLLVFPSWAPHEVMPISCPSRRFADSRFAINCWVYRARS